MVIHQTEREIPSVLADSHWLTAFSDCKTRNSLSQHFSLRPELSPDLGLRQWPAIGKNVKHRHDLGLKTLWRENKFLSTRFWQF